MPSDEALQIRAEYRYGLYDDLLAVLGKSSAEVAHTLLDKANQWSVRNAEHLAQLLEKQHSYFDRLHNVHQTLDTTLGHFKATLVECTTVTRELTQLTDQTNAMVTAAVGVTKRIEDAGKAIERVAQKAAQQAEYLTEVNSQQEAVQQRITSSMQRYQQLFGQVEEASGKLLAQVGQHLHHYTETTRQGFDHLTRAADEHFANATSRLGETVNELDEYLQDLTSILERFRTIGEGHGRSQR